MSEFNPELRAEMERGQHLEWVRGQLKDYEEVFNLSDDDLRGKKILEVGAADRRFAASCILNDVTKDVWSLEPALGEDEKSGYADKEYIREGFEKLPQDLRQEIDKKTVISTAEDTPFGDSSFDLVIGRSVPFESSEQLAKRLQELLRVGREVRLYPVVSRDRAAFEEAVAAVSKSSPVDAVFKTTLDIEMGTGEDARRVKEDVLIIRVRK